MRFLVDTQLPRALALWLREQGHEAAHVLDVGLAQGKDTFIWRHAEETHAVVIPNDEDFAEWGRRDRPGPSVVWLRTGNCSKRALLGWFEALLPGIVRQLDQRDRLVEVR